MKSLRSTLTVAFVLALAGCSSTIEDAADLPPLEPTEDSTSSTAVTTDPPAPSSTEAPTSSTSSTSPAVADAPRPTVEIPTEWDSPEEEIFGRYLAYWAVVRAATAPPVLDPDHPLLDDVAIPDMAADVRAVIVDYRDADQVFVWDEESDDDHNLWLPNVAPLDKTEGNRVLVQDCWIRTYQIVNRNDGMPTESFDDFVLYNATMEVIGGQWLVHSNIEQQPGDPNYDRCEQLAERS